MKKNLKFTSFNTKSLIPISYSKQTYFKLIFYELFLKEKKLYKS
jgi:hypothetical protein